MELRDGLGSGVAGIVLAGEELLAIFSQRRLLRDLALVPVMAELCDHFGLGDLGRARLVGKQLAADRARPVFLHAVGLAGRGDLLGLRERMRQFGDRFALLYDLLAVDAVEVAGVAFLGAGGVLGVLQDGGMTRREQNGVRLGDLGHALGVGKELAAGIALPVRLHAGSLAGRGHFFNCRQLVAESRDDLGFFDLGLARFVGKELAAGIALPVRLHAVGLAGCGHFVDFLQVMAERGDHFGFFDLVLASFIGKELAANLAHPVRLHAVFLAGRGLFGNFDHIMFMRTDDDRIVLVRGIVQRSDIERVKSLADVQRDSVGLARFVIREQRRLTQILTILIHGINSGEILVVRHGDGHIAGLGIILTALDHRRKAVDHNRNAVLEILRAVDNDLLGRHRAERVLAIGEVRVEVQNDLGVVRDGLAVRAVNVRTVEQEPGIGAEAAFIRVKNGLRAVRRIVHCVDLIGLGIARDHDDVARVADDRGNHEELGEVRAVGVVRYRDAVLAVNAALGVAQRRVAGIDLRGVLVIDEVGHRRRGVGLPLHIVHRILGVFRIDLHGQQLAPVVRLQDRARSPVAVEAHVRDMRELVVTGILVIIIEVQITFDVGAVGKKTIEEFLRIIGKRDRHGDGLLLAGSEGDGLGSVRGEVNAFLKQLRLHGVIDRAPGAADRSVAEHIQRHIEGALRVAGVLQLGGDGEHAALRGIIAQLGERIRDGERGGVRRREIHHTGALAARAEGNVITALILVVNCDICTGERAVAGKGSGVGFAHALVIRIDRFQICSVAAGHVRGGHGGAGIDRVAILGTVEDRVDVTADAGDGGLDLQVVRRAPAAEARHAPALGIFNDRLLRLHKKRLIFKRFERLAGSQRNEDRGDRCRRDRHIDQSFGCVVINDSANGTGSRGVGDLFFKGDITARNDGDLAMYVDLGIIFCSAEVRNHHIFQFLSGELIEQSSAVAVVILEALFADRDLVGRILGVFHRGNRDVAVVGGGRTEHTVVGIIGRDIAAARPVLGVLGHGVFVAGGDAADHARTLQTLIDPVVEHGFGVLNKTVRRAERHVDHVGAELISVLERGKVNVRARGGRL